MFWQCCTGLDNAVETEVFPEALPAPTLLSSTANQKTSSEAAPEKAPLNSALVEAVPITLAQTPEVASTENACVGLKGMASSPTQEDPVIVANDTSDPVAVTEDIAVVTQEKHPLAKAAALGRYAAAHRELLDLQKSGGDPEQFLDKAAIERVNRIGATFAGATRLFKMKPDDLKMFEENKKLNLKWGLKLEGAKMIVVSIVDYNDANFLKMACLDLEPDLEDKISEDEIVQELFSQPHAHDVSWRKRMVKSGVGTKSDDILVVSSVDALDESLQAVCSLKYTLDKSATADPYGTPIPARDAGHERTPYQMTVTALTPLAIGGDKMRGVRKFECVEVELPSVVSKILGVMPGFMLKKMCRGNVETKVRLTLDFVQTSQEIDKRQHSQPRSGFFEHVRSHIVA